jgi:hypothetical protein
MTSVLTHVRSRRTRGAALVAATAALLMAGASAAQSDTFYNDLDGTVDSVFETMNLTYNSTTLVGTTGSTVLHVRADDAPDHPNCNVQGAAHFVTVTGVSSDTGVAVLTTGPTFTFNTCDDLLTVGVQATGLGTATISFTVTDSDSSSDPHILWSTVEADFVVNVTEGGGTSTGCDADPAAPAWAAAILQKSGYKPGAKQTTNLISKIANEMTQQARFAGFDKNDHPSYEDAVQARLEVLTGNPNLASAQESARPGWVCTQIS